MQEHRATIFTLILLVSIVALSGQTINGLHHLTYKPEGIHSTQGANTGAKLGTTIAKTCYDLMRYQGRPYVRYNRCCSEECTRPCKDEELSLGDLRSCMRICSSTCERTLTNRYLTFQPGAWMS